MGSNLRRLNDGYYAVGTYLRLSRLTAWLKCTPTDIARWIRNDGFPAPVLLNRTTRRWKEWEIAAWLENRGQEYTPAPDLKRRTDAWVYFIRCGLFVKIGVANNVKKRLAALQTANPEPLEVMGQTWGGFRLEQTLHDRFAEHRVRDSAEWFLLVDEIQDYIRGLQ